MTQPFKYTKVVTEYTPNTYVEAFKDLVNIVEEREQKIREFEESKDCELLDDTYAMLVAKIVIGMTDSASKITIKPRNPKDLSRIEFTIKIGRSLETEFKENSTVWMSKRRKWYPRDKWTQLIRNLYDEWALDSESNKYVYTGNKYK